MKDINLTILLPCPGMRDRNRNTEIGFPDYQQETTIWAESKGPYHALVHLDVDINVAIIFCFSEKKQIINLKCTTFSCIIFSNLACHYNIALYF